MIEYDAFAKSRSDAFRQLAYRHDSSEESNATT